MTEPHESTISYSTGFYSLQPDDVMNAVETAGFVPTGEFQQLNSYENRVFDIKLENTKHLNDLARTSTQEPIDRLIAKFYRPGRWSKSAIQEEHDFLIELKNHGIPAIAPIRWLNDETVYRHGELWVGLFPRFSGRMPQEFLDGELKSVGRSLAQIHNIGSQKPAQHRPMMNSQDYGWPNLDLLEDWVDRSVWPRYEEAACHLLDHLDENLDEDDFIRIHGDCHRGNLLNNGEEFFFVDFDDFLNGPVAQDFWMLFSGDRFLEQETQEILSGYEELRSFPDEQLDLLKPLRGLRILHYAAWIAKRWQDPSFPKLFPEFNSYQYWAEETESLEKIAWAL